MSVFFWELWRAHNSSRKYAFMAKKEVHRKRVISASFSLRMRRPPKSRNVSLENPSSFVSRLLIRSWNDNMIQPWFHIGSTIEVLLLPFQERFQSHVALVVTFEYKQDSSVQSYFSQKMEKNTPKAGSKTGCARKAFCRLGMSSRTPCSSRKGNRKGEVVF